MMRLSWSVVDYVFFLFCKLNEITWRSLEMWGTKSAFLMIPFIAVLPRKWCRMGRVTAGTVHHSRVGRRSFEVVVLKLGKMRSDATPDAIALSRFLGLGYWKAGRYLLWFKTRTSRWGMFVGFNVRRWWSGTEHAWLKVQPVSLK